jgi:uncharacterized protein (DUF58 family)
MRRPRVLNQALRWAALGLKPNQRLRPTREGRSFFVVWLALMGIGLYLQSNLVLLIAGLAAGPLVASVIVSATTLRRLAVTRRAPSYVFAGDPLRIDYVLDNSGRFTAALAIAVDDDLAPAERASPEASRVRPQVTFARVAGRQHGRERWEGTGPARGRYRFEALEVATRSPFGLLERRMSETTPAQVLVYPRIGQLQRPWHRIYRESTETRRGRRHDRSAQQQEYHGLRDYRPGDSSRLIHWRTSARVGQPMVKEFEQQNEQDLAILLDAWLPRSKATPEQRELLEEAIRFAATLAVEASRQAGRRIALGWTGPNPGVVQGPTSTRLLHEQLGQLAVLRGSAEGQLSALLDSLPPPVLRDGLLVIVATRPVNLVDEMDRSTRLRGTAGRGLAARTILLDASRGDLDGLVAYGEGPADTGRVADGRPAARPSWAAPSVDGAVGGGTRA